MKDLLPRLATHQIEEIARALGSGRLRPPYTGMALQQYLPSELLLVAAAGFTELHAQGVSAAGLAAMLEAVAADRVCQSALHGSIEIVSTGPEAPGVTNRDTAAVVRDLFTQAESDVLVVGYAVHNGREVFEPLARRMQELPSLRVRLLLDVRREGPDTSADSQIAARFIYNFRNKEWPGTCVPAIFHDPRALALDRRQRASLHAKCIVVDRRRAFVSSANLTRAAQQRNIELGLLVNEAGAASRIAQHYDRLIESGVLRALL
jgi:phosphatidylserine/phosphatidylglycerophosphate/cardiolipin synthase-like enzyme